MLVKAIVYDLDGTLVNSAQIVIEILNRMRVERGLEPLPLERYIPWMSVGGIEMIRNALDESDPDAIKKDLSRFRQSYIEMPTPNESIYSGVRDVLKYLSNKGYQLGVCTNKPRVLVDKIMSETGLGEFFSFIQAGGDIPVKKPHPDTLKLCISNLESNHINTLMVGDSTVDQRLAINCKTDFVFFSNGYDDGVDRSKVKATICEHQQIIDYIRIR